MRAGWTAPLLKVFVSTRLGTRLWCRSVLTPGHTGMSGRLERLTDREREVLAAIARGSSNAEISEELFIGAATVKSHVSSILTKLGLRDCAQAVVFAYESGLAEAGDRDIGH